MRLVLTNGKVTIYCIVSTQSCRPSLDCWILKHRDSTQERQNVELNVTTF